MKLAIFIASALGAYILATTGTSGAYYRELHGSICTPTSSNVNYSQHGVYNTSYTSSASAYCAVPEDSSYNKSNATALTVYVYDGSTAEQASFAACVGYRSSYGGTCGPSASSGAAATGNLSISVSLSAWQNNPTGIANVGITLPKGIAATVKGFRITWP